MVNIIAQNNFIIYILFLLYCLSFNIWHCLIRDEMIDANCQEWHARDLSMFLPIDVILMEMGNSFEKIHVLLFCTVFSFPLLEHSH